MAEHRRSTRADVVIPLNDQIKAMLSVMEQIAARVDPGPPHQWRSPHPIWEWAAAQDATIRLRSIVATEAEVARMKARVG
jgi:hypothetical protein